MNTVAFLKGLCESIGFDLVLRIVDISSFETRQKMFGLSLVRYSRILEPILKQVDQNTAEVLGISTVSCTAFSCFASNLDSCASEQATKALESRGHSAVLRLAMCRLNLSSIVVSWQGLQRAFYLLARKFQ